MSYDAQTSDRATIPEDLFWLDAFDQAITRNDEPEIWRLIHLQDQRSTDHDTLSTAISRMSYRIGRRTRFTELFLMPVISSDCSLFDQPERFRPASVAVSEALDQWIGHENRKTIFKTVFSGLRSFDRVSTWSPLILRRHIHQALPGSNLAKISYPTEDIQLPAGAPRLGFIALVLTSERGWPQLTAADTERSQRLVNLVSYALLDRIDAVAPEVLTPKNMQSAIADGVILWLKRLNEAVGITGWSAAPVASTTDVLKITLRLAITKGGSEWSQFIIRKHQIGSRGVQTVLGLLSDMAVGVDMLVS